MEKEIIIEMMKFLENTAVESIGPSLMDFSDDKNSRETLLLSLRSLNARYDKNDALIHVRGIMHKYNIQLDEVAGVSKLA